MTQTTASADAILKDKYVAENKPTNFDRLASKLASQPGVRSPKGLAAKIGRDKLGPAQFQAKAARGR